MYRSHFVFVVSANSSAFWNARRVQKQDTGGSLLEAKWCQNNQAILASQISLSQSPEFVIFSCRSQVHFYSLFIKSVFFKSISGDRLALTFLFFLRYMFEVYRSLTCVERVPSPYSRCINHEVLTRLIFSSFGNHPTAIETVYWLAWPLLTAFHENAFGNHSCEFQVDYLESNQYSIGQNYGKLD